LLDPMQPDPQGRANLAPAPPSSGTDDIIEIDWEEVEAPAASTRTPAPPGDAGPRDKTSPDDRLMKSSSADFELGEAPPSSQDELIEEEPPSDVGLTKPSTGAPTPRRVEAEEVDIADFLSEDESSSVRLTREAPRTGRPTGRSEPPPAGGLDEAEAAVLFPEEGAIAPGPRSEETSAVNLASPVEVGVNDSGRGLPPPSSGVGAIGEPRHQWDERRP